MRSVVVVALLLVAVLVGAAAPAGAENTPVGLKLRAYLNQENGWTALVWQDLDFVTPTETLYVAVHRFNAATGYYEVIGQGEVSGLLRRFLVRRPATELCGELLVSITRPDYYPREVAAAGTYSFNCVRLPLLRK